MVDFMAEVGKPLDPWQASVVLDAFGLREDGLWSSVEVAVLVARQNGKGGITEAIELAGLYLFRDRLIMHSAHLFKTATQSFQRLVDIIHGSDWLMKRTKAIVRARGDEAIQLTPQAGGGQLMCFSRHGGSGRGFTGDKTVFDEAAYLTVEQYAAATPTLATVPNPQIIYTGTPPDEDVGPMPENAMLPSVRSRGHAGDDRLTLHEWSPPDKFDLEDPDVWAGCNPALGIRIQGWFLAKQLKNFTAAGRPQKFATEHLGAWPDDPTKQWLVIPQNDWTDAEDTQSKALDPVALAVDVTPDRTWTAVGAAGNREDGSVHIEVAAHRPGTRWVVPWLLERDAKWRPSALVVNDKALADDCETAGLEVYRPTVPDTVSACGRFYDGVSSPDVSKRNVRHIGQEELETALAGAMKRDLGGSWAWDRRNVMVDICPLVAVTLALFGHLTPRVHREPAQEFFASWR